MQTSSTLPRTFFITQWSNYFGMTLGLGLYMGVYYGCTADFTSSTGRSLAIITIVVHVLLIAVLVGFALINPGFIPKIDLQERSRIPLERRRLQDMLREESYIDRQYLFTIKSHNLPIRFCSYCPTYRPLRAVHCHSCNTCVERMDHHCPWIGVCIGKRNYRVYWLMLFSMCLLTWLIYAQLIRVVARPWGQVELPIFIVNIVEFLFLLPASLFVYVLTVFHLRLSCWNETTNEYCHSRWIRPSGNPYSKYHCCRNPLQICFKVYKPIEPLSKLLSSIAESSLELPKQQLPN